MLLVQKYGGTSVAGPERIRSVAERIARHRAAGTELVVVVSAMGDATDELVSMAQAIAPDAAHRHPRELDMLLTAGERISMALLAMAIREMDVEAISFTGSQAAIITDSRHAGARIQEVGEVGMARLREELAAGRVVIVAGFQGVSREREVTTLGRGGSDTTAVALAAALGAERCDIFTDVDGVHTADPRVVEDARRIDRLDYQEMIELALAGAQVMHPRAVELGARYHVPIRVLSSLKGEEDGGTLIMDVDRSMEGMALTGLAAEAGYALLTLRGLDPSVGTTATILEGLADAGISIDMLTQTDRADGRRQVQVSVGRDELSRARSICEELTGSLGGERVDVREGLSRVALVGSGMHGRPGVFARAFRTLVDAEIEVYGVTASSVTIAVLVEESREREALSLLHASFELERGAS